MRGLLGLVAGMGVLILAGVGVIGVTIAHRLGGAAPIPASPLAAVLDQPAGTQIVGVSDAGDRLAVALRGGGPDRVVIVDEASGRVVATVALAR